MDQDTKILILNRLAKDKTNILIGNVTNETVKQLEELAIIYGFFGFIASAERVEREAAAIKEIMEN